MFTSAVSVADAGARLGKPAEAKPDDGKPDDEESNEFQLDPGADENGDVDVPKVEKSD